MKIEKVFEYQVKQIYKEFIVRYRSEDFKVIQIGGHIDIFKKVSKGYKHLKPKKNQKLYKNIIPRLGIDLCSLCCDE